MVSFTMPMGMTGCFFSKPPLLVTTQTRLRMLHGADCLINGKYYTCNNAVFTKPFHGEMKL